MSYPQAIASQEVLDGSMFYRLYSQLQSGGDAYEIDVSGKGFALGPNSDLSSVRLTYFDPSQPNQVNSVVVGIDTPFYGTLAALASEQYPVANTRARIIVTPEDLWNNNWFPSLLAQDFSYHPPRVDLITYLQDPLGLAVKRQDFVERGRLQIDPANSAYLIIVPFYGRQYAQLVVRNKSAAPIATMTVDAVAVTFSTDGNATFTTGIAAENPVITAGVVSGGAGDTTTFRVLTSTHGTFDYLMFRINLGVAGGINAATNDAVRYFLRTSDTEPGA